MAVIVTKRGDTLRLRCRWTDTTGAAVPLAGAVIAAWLRRGPVIIQMVPDITDVLDGTFSLSVASGDTDALTVGDWLADVEFQINGRVVSSETFTLAVLQDITNAP